MLFPRINHVSNPGRALVHAPKHHAFSPSTPERLSTKCQAAFAAFSLKIQSVQMHIPAFVPIDAQFKPIECISESGNFFRSVGTLFALGTIRGFRPVAMFPNS